MPIGAGRGEAWVIIPEGPFVVEVGWCSFVSHDVINFTTKIGWLLTVVDDAAAGQYYIMLRAACLVVQG